MSGARSDGLCSVDDVAAALVAAFGDLTAILGLTGLIMLWRIDKMNGAILTSILLTYSAPSYLIQVGARQRFPADGLLILLSVGAFTAYIGRKSSAKRSAAAA